LEESRTNLRRASADVPGGDRPSFPLGSSSSAGRAGTRGSAAQGQLPPIVFAIDESYVRPLCVALTSLAASCAPVLGQLRVVLVYEELSAYALQTVQRTAKSLRLLLRAIQLPERMPDYAPSRWSSATYLRLSIPSLLSDEKFALYLDTDVLILGDLTPLLTTDLQTACVGAVRDSLSPTVGQSVLPGWKELGMREGSEYFNAGVMLINLEAWREQQVAARCRDLLLAYPQYITHPDQDALNYVLRDSWVRLDSLWNVFAASALEKIGWLDFSDDGSRARRLHDDEGRARILHYAGPKPWEPGYPESYALDIYQSFERAYDTSCLAAES
jgi:lipopolysaccharide biosynthesis glycosyltransferase